MKERKILKMMKRFQAYINDVSLKSKYKGVGNLGNKKSSALYMSAFRWKHRSKQDGAAGNSRCKIVSLGSSAEPPKICITDATSALS